MSYIADSFNKKGIEDFIIACDDLVYQAKPNIIEGAIWDGQVPAPQLFYNKEPKSKTWSQRIDQLIHVMNLQCSEGNWDTSEYMRGLANGLILAYHIMIDSKEEIEYKLPQVCKDYNI